jgi:long-chain acyl-CoA synthetase
MQQQPSSKDRGISVDPPWLAHYPAHIPRNMQASAETLIQAFQECSRRSAESPALILTDGILTFRDLDYLSDALAALLAHRGVGYRDRVALYLQNDPQLVLGQLACWKLGAIAVSINPMLKPDELRYILNDSGASVLLSLRDLYQEAASTVISDTAVKLVLLTAQEDVPRLIGQVGVRGSRRKSTDEGVAELTDVIAPWRGHSVAYSPPRSRDIATIIYTSGTTGHPKGVQSTHANILHNAVVYREWLSIGPSDVFVCGAPLFHVTGLVAGTGLSYVAGTPMVLMHRFDPEDFLRLTYQHRGTATVMVIAAFRAILRSGAVNDNLASLTKVYSGGAPVSLEASQEWERATGSPIHNVYGLTETCSPSHAVPLGVRPPVDADTGAMSVGVPVPGARVRVVDEQFCDVPIGAQGEILVAGPMVTPGYWNNDAANDASFHEGYLRTGDLGKMSPDGWFFVNDRLKDMINAAGYKVSPREVEQRLEAHPAVLEAAVTGEPDNYRGETVKAYVILRPGFSVTPADLIGYARERMAAFKYPRKVEIVTDLPRTASGKVLRRELRERLSAPKVLPHSGQETIRDD